MKNDESILSEVDFLIWIFIQRLLCKMCFDVVTTFRTKKSTFSDTLLTLSKNLKLYSFL